MDSLRNTVIPQQVSVDMTRNYGETANEKAVKLIEKLIFATASVVVLVFFSLGRREAAIVGLAVVLTLSATLFASWAWGFTLNRVSLFALIFSIGILVDDAIVVVENIHRHKLLRPDATLASLIPAAVDEVGGPTILATLTVIAALLPMAFVSGLMGPYMSPIPINASMGMLISLAIAFTITPWLARRWLSAAAVHQDGLAARLHPLAQKVFSPFLAQTGGKRARRLLMLGVMGLLLLSIALPVARLVVLKMLPFDNKSELQLVVDMPAGSALEDTAAALHEMTAWLAQQPEVQNYQAYAGVAAPSTSMAWCGSTTCVPVMRAAMCRWTCYPRASAIAAAMPLRWPSVRPCSRLPRVTMPGSKWWKCRPDRRSWHPSWPKFTARTFPGVPH
jgi:multidrug efflux pump subunit AcrB